MLCNLVVKGNKVEVDKILNLFSDKPYGELEKTQSEGNIYIAWIKCSGVKREKAVDMLTNVNWIGFIKDCETKTLQVATSNIGSAQIDALYTVYEYDDNFDFYGDDPIASQYYPDSDFEAEIFWDSTCVREVYFYECPCEEWFNQE